MTNKMRVKPNREDCPAHPIDGALAPEGGLWTADQFTFRRLRDGDIVEIKDSAPATEERRARTAPPE